MKTTLRELKQLVREALIQRKSARDVNVRKVQDALTELTSLIAEAESAGLWDDDDGNESDDWDERVDMLIDAIKTNDHARIAELAPMIAWAAYEIVDLSEDDDTLDPSYVKSVSKRALKVIERIAPETQPQPPPGYGEDAEGDL